MRGDGYAMRGGADPAAIAQLLQAKAQAVLAEKQTEAIEKTTAIAQQQANASTSAVNRKFFYIQLRMIGQFIKNVATLIRNLLKPLGIILKDLSPYIALALVIYLLFWGYTHGAPKLKFGESSKRRDDVFKKQKTRWERFRDWLGERLAFLAPGHRYRQILRMLNPLAGTFKKLPRPVMPHGRCDDVNWRELGGDGRAGLCARTNAPKDLQWIMDTDKMPELGRLPNALYAKATNGGKKLQVTIPWALQGTFYVPQCAKATFADGAPAGGLFKDEGMACRRLEVRVPTYGQMYRVKGGALDDYATASDPKC